MNTEYQSTSQDKSFIPISLVSLSVLIFFISQWLYISSTKSTLAGNSAKMDAFATGDYLKELDTQVAKAKQIEQALQTLATDIAKLAQDDKNEAAQKIVIKYGIKYSPPAATPAP